MDRNVCRPHPGSTFSDAILASYAMATDSSKWDINMLIRMCNDRRFQPTDVTFRSADAMLAAVSDIVVVVSSIVSLPPPRLLRPPAGGTSQ